MAQDIPPRGVIEDGWFERARGIPMTKAPIRAVILSLLAPLAGFRVLEIGSGTGAMTVELLRASGAGSVTSIDVSAEAFGLVRRNVERAGLASRARLIVGRAPEDVPPGAFDAAFIGGHGQALEAVIKSCWDRLTPGGRVLLSSITPGSTSRALACFDELRASVGFWRAHTSCGGRVGSEWLLIGNNPIDFIWGDRV
ncbi:MAG: precorrin-6Y C5,15-methyltransferase (decarboxylating) subunit CbiT [Synergistaceae bacterium]|jgi:precorrin-6Y C5,15-methyltransferase (decarboxylating) CbiT subunit|nr:precorrin-6Y C5,15-methyltransferase (decarboxylating) subunit CbiT [Synergistaceae bacterium]